MFYTLLCYTYFRLMHLSNWVLRLNEWWYDDIVGGLGVWLG